MVEYMLGVSVIVIGLAVGFFALTNSTTVTFKHTSDVVVAPFP